MTLVVEDGTGLANANSYGSVAEATAYFADFPSRSTTWTGKTLAEQEEALILGTQYLDAEYGDDWIGDKRFKDSGLDWPREDAVTPSGHVVDANEVPARLKKALFEAAFLSTPVGTVTLLAAIDNPGDIKRIKQKADVVEQDITYGGAGAEQQPKYPVIDGLLRELTSGASIGLRRQRG